MITVSFYKNAEGIYTGFKTSGHAGFAENGQDIICAGVSALVINTVNSIDTFTSDKYTIDTEEESGFIEFKILTNISKESVLLLNSLLLGLQGIREENGHDYIQLLL